MGDPDFELIGRTVGEYQVTSRVGAGGMGVVYEGNHPLIGKRVAVKVLLPSLTSNPEQVSRFLSEARAVNAVRHRGIVDIFSFGQLPDGAHYFVMEYLEGQGFEKVIKTRGPLVVGEALLWIGEVLEALAAAHHVGIIHRDIKPSNLFLVDTGRGRPYVKLLDFGIAKGEVLMGRGAAKTNASMVIGTPEYMSPEQVCGLPISPATDLYAVGVVLFEMVTRRRLFRGENQLRTMWMHAEEPPPHARDFNPAVSTELDELLQWVLRKEPMDRPRSAEELGQHVEALLRALPEDQAPSASPAFAGRPISSPSVRSLPRVSAVPPPSSPRAPAPELVSARRNEVRTVPDGGSAPGSHARPTSTDKVPAFVPPAEQEPRPHQVPRQPETAASVAPSAPRLAAVETRPLATASPVLGAAPSAPSARAGPSFSATPPPSKSSAPRPATGARLAGPRPNVALAPTAATEPANASAPHPAPAPPAERPPLNDPAERTLRRAFAGAVFLLIAAVLWVAPLGAAWKAVTKPFRSAKPAPVWASPRMAAEVPPAPPAAASAPAPSAVPPRPAPAPPTALAPAPTAAEPVRAPAARVATTPPKGAEPSRPSPAPARPAAPAARLEAPRAPAPKLPSKAQLANRLVELERRLVSVETASGMTDNPIRPKLERARHAVADADSDAQVRSAVLLLDALASDLGR